MNSRIGRRLISGLVAVAIVGVIVSAVSLLSIASIKATFRATHSPLS
jgi:CHASE3 domain sensor protein